MAAEPTADRYVEVDGVNTRYWSLGEQGSPVLLIHGLAGFVENWAPNVAALSQQYRVYALDLVGFGRSDKPIASYSLPYLAGFVHSFMAAQDVEHAVLVGNSMGGGVALNLALRFPDQVDALVLVDPIGFGKQVSPTLRVFSLPWVGELFSPPSRKATIQLWEEIFWDGSIITDELIDLAYDIWNQPGGDNAFLAALRSMINLWGVRREVTDQIVTNLSRITMPTLVVWGEQDRLLPVAQANVAVEGLPDARRHIFDPCGHAPQLECPEEFNALVLDFLASQGKQA